jgi:hypothetical protein
MSNEMDQILDKQPELTTSAVGATFDNAMKAQEEQIKKVATSSYAAPLPKVAAKEAQISADQSKQILEALKNLNKNPKINRTSSPTALDFSALDESAIYDLSIDIPIYSHELPDYMKVELADNNYVARWVLLNPARIGPLRATGWSYVTADDLKEELTVEIEPNENGHFQYVDVVLMKCLKTQHFSKLRAQYIRGENMVKPGNAQAMGASQAEDYLTATRGDEYKRAVGEKQIGIYKPGVVI